MTRGRPPVAVRRLLEFYMRWGAWCKLTTQETARAAGLTAWQVVKGRRALEAQKVVELRSMRMADEGATARIWVRALFEPDTLVNSVLRYTTEERNTIRNDVRGSKSKRVEDKDDMEIILSREDTPPESLPRATDPKEEAPSVQFLNVFRAAFKRKFGSTPGTGGYRSTGQDRRLAKQLTDAYGLELLQAAVRTFFAMNGYGSPTIGNFTVRCEELMVSVREDALLKREREARPETAKQEERDATRVTRIVDSLFDGTLVDKDRAWLKKQVANWSPAKRYAKHNQSIMRAALTDEEFAEHEEECRKHGR
ncbi:hypothetical protein LCGC14_1711260 [marine sediment metagenome]|uniref:Uncharacterized protein n=1 Tax=marine sediment metagenome TaxID=412755 RepID=A0A0F9KF48_9ZZZZ